MAGVPIGRGNLDRHAHRKNYVQAKGKDGICKLKREISEEETNPTDTLILDFQLPEQ